MIIVYHAENVAAYKITYSSMYIDLFMTCFCGCIKYVKNTAAGGFKIGCVSCSHGPQNHDDEFKSNKKA